MRIEFAVRREYGRQGRASDFAASDAVLDCPTCSDTQDLTEGSVREEGEVTTYRCKNGCGEPLLEVGPASAFANRGDDTSRNVEARAIGGVAVVHATNLELRNMLLPASDPQAPGPMTLRIRGYRGDAWPGEDTSKWPNPPGQES